MNRSNLSGRIKYDSRINEYKYDTNDFNLLVKIKEQCEYIPLINVNTYNIYLHHSIDKSLKGLPLLKHCVAKYISRSVEPYSEIKKLISNPIYCHQFIKLNYMYTGRCSYKSLFDDNYYSRYKLLNSFNYFNAYEGIIQGSEYIGIIKNYNHTFERMVFIMTIKKEYLTYFHQCILLGKTPRPEIFTLIVDKSFDHKNTLYPNIRKAFRKYILRPSIMDNINVYYVDDIYKLMFEKYTFNGNSPVMYNKNKKEFINELCNYNENNN